MPETCAVCGSALCFNGACNNLPLRSTPETLEREFALARKMIEARKNIRYAYFGPVERGWTEADDRAFEEWMNE